MWEVPRTEITVWCFKPLWGVEGLGTGPRGGSVPSVSRVCCPPRLAVSSRLRKISGHSADSETTCSVRLSRPCRTTCRVTCVESSGVFTYLFAVCCVSEAISNLVSPRTREEQDPTPRITQSVGYNPPAADPLGRGQNRRAMIHKAWGIIESSRAQRRPKRVDWQTTQTKITAGK